jgi:hypothetical protein
MLSHQTKDFDGSDAKKLKKATTKEMVSKFLTHETDKEHKQIEELRKEEEIRGGENFLQLEQKRELSTQKRKEEEEAREKSSQRKLESNKSKQEKEKADIEAA